MSIRDFVHTRVVVRTVVAGVFAAWSLTCDRPDPPGRSDKTPATREASVLDGRGGEGRGLTRNPLDVTPAAPPAPILDSEAASRPASLAAATLTVGDQAIVFPPVTLRLLGNGVVLVSSDTDAGSEPGNTFSFQTTPETDADPATGEWTHATYTYTLANPEEQPADGIRSAADPSNGLRPVELQLTLDRAEPQSTDFTVTLEGRFVSLAADNPLKAASVEVAGTFAARLVR